MGKNGSLKLPGLFGISKSIFHGGTVGGVVDVALGGTEVDGKISDKVHIVSCVPELVKTCFTPSTQ